MKRWRLKGGAIRSASQEEGRHGRRRPASSPFDMPGSSPRVFVDLTLLFPDGVSGGIKPALFEMLRWLARRHDPPLSFVYAVKEGFESEVAAFARPADRLLPARDLPPDIAARELCDVVYCPFGSTSLACPGIPTVTLVVDLLHRDFPATINEGELAMRESWFRAAVARSDRFQTISDYTGLQLGRHYGVEPGRMFRTYLPIHARFQPAGAAARAPFFYYPANAWAHKNHAGLLHGYAAYLRHAGPAAWRLVLTGADDQRMDGIRRLATELQVATHVDFLGYVSEARLAELWQAAGALVFPSLHEGFGIPLLEAMAHGVPIVTSRATAIPEVAGPAALYVDVRDSSELAAALQRVATDQALRAELVRQGRLELVRFHPDREFGKLQEAFITAAKSPACWLRDGYYSVDGLTDPIARFALPRPLRPGVLQASFRPLPAARQVQVWCGPDLVGEKLLPASAAATAAWDFTPRTAALTIRVPDASRLSLQDPRTHGVLLERLSWHQPGCGTDLLHALGTPAG